MCERLGVPAREANLSVFVISGETRSQEASRNSTDKATGRASDMRSHISEARQISSVFLVAMVKRSTDNNYDRSLSEHGSGKEG
jgi:hypothetical protein